MLLGISVVESSFLPSSTPGIYRIIGMYALVRKPISAIIVAANPLSGSSIHSISPENAEITVRFQPIAVAANVSEFRSEMLV